MSSPCILVSPAPFAIYEGAFPIVDRGPVGTRGPGRGQEPPVEHEMSVGDEPGGLLPVAREQLPDRHPARDLVDDGPEPSDQLGEVGGVAVVAVLLAVPRRVALDHWIGEQLGMLQERVEDVQAEPVDAAIQPTPDHLPLGGLDRLLPPIQVRLLREERVEVELLPPRLPLPGRAAEDRQPVVGRQRRAVGVEAGRVGPQVPVRVRALTRGPARPEPGVLVGGVVHDQVEDHPQAAPMGLVDEAVEVGLAPVGGVDGGVVAAWRREDGAH